MSLYKWRSLEITFSVNVSHYLCNKPYENIDFFKETCPSLFLPLEAYTTVLRGIV